MSGRWRSRYWRQEDETSAAKDESISDQQRRRREESGAQRNNSGWEERDRDRYGSNLNQRQQPQHNQSRSWNYHDQEERGEWRRAQRVPVPVTSSGVDANTRLERPSNNSNPPRHGTGGDGVKKEPRESSSRPSYDRSSVPPAPQNKWGRPDGPKSTSSNFGNSSQRSNDNNTPPLERRARAKPDNSNKPNIAIKKEDPPSNAASANPILTKKKSWAKLDSNISSAGVLASAEHAMAPSPAETIQNKSITSSKSTVKAENDLQHFPSSLTGSKKKNPWAKSNSPAKPSPSSNNPTYPSLAEEATNNKQTAPAVISATSSWGKPQLPSSAGWGKKSSIQQEQHLQSSSKKNANAKVTDFPSLSSALSAPRSQQKQQLASSALSKEQPANNKGSKKGTPVSNLASFLSPQPKQQKQAETKQILKRGTTNNSKSIATKTLSSTKQNTVGVKRSAPSSTGASHGNREDSRQFHPTMCGNKTNGTPSLKKGRQRLAPRKKKLTTLKKRVLEERLRMWKEHNEIDDSKIDGVEGDSPSTKRAKVDNTHSEANETSTSGEVLSSLPNTTTLRIENFIRPEEDDLEDEDEYDEIVSNLINLAGRVGKVLNVFVPRRRLPSNSEDAISNDVEKDDALQEAKLVGWSFVRFAANKDVRAAKDILDGMVVGGQQIHTFILEGRGICACNDIMSGEIGVAPSAENEREWRLAVLQAMNERQNLAEERIFEQSNNFSHTDLEVSATNTVVFHNILCDDDYDDDEALEESIADIKGLAMQYGQVADARAAITGIDKGNVYILYNNREAAEKSVQQLNGMVVGGSKILVNLKSVSLDKIQQHHGPVEVILNNVLNENDFEDEDCLNESIEDISNLARKYGVIGKVYVDIPEGKNGRVRVEYLDGRSAAQHAAQELDGMVVGGLILSAKVSSDGENSTHNQSASSSNVNASLAAPSEKVKNESPPPMLSGDKVIPERFAACKRVPKIPNPGVPRAYASKISDERATPLLIEMLGELMRLQERNKDDKNARARRRLVMGLREVARGIRAHKVKMVVMANNLDGSFVFVVFCFCLVRHFESFFIRFTFKIYYPSFDLLRSIV